MSDEQIEDMFREAIKSFPEQYRKAATEWLEKHISVSRAAPVAYSAGARFTPE